MGRNWIYGRNVVLTGCSTGIGRELALLLGKKYGCNIVGVARNIKKLESLKSELNGKFIYRRGDVSDKEFFKNLAQELDEMNFKVDILINNAGMIQPFTSYGDLSYEQIERTNNVNYNSVLYACKEFIPYIKKSPYGGIVNVSSASALLPVAGESIYSASKCAVRGLTETLYQELKGYGVYVGLIMPGPVKTDIYKAREHAGETKAKVSDNLVENVGVTAEKAAKKIVGIMKRRKSRFALGFIAKMMGLGMSLVPRFTLSATGWAIKKGGEKKVASFKPVFEEMREKKEFIKQNKKKRKKVTYRKAEDCPRLDCMK